MNAYQLGIQQALFDAGLVKQAAGWGWPAAAGGAALLGAGAGALSSKEDKRRGAMAGALGGLGAVAGARYGTGRLTKFLQNVMKTELARGLPPAVHMKKIMQNPNVKRWVNKRIGAGAALGLGGLGAGIGFGSRVTPPSEDSSSKGDGLFGLTPGRASQLQSLLPVVQQMYAASQGGAPLPSLAAYSMFPEQSYADAPGAMGPKFASMVGGLARSAAKSVGMAETRDILGTGVPEWKRVSPLSAAVEAAKDVVENILGKTEPESVAIETPPEVLPVATPEIPPETKIE